MLRTNSLKNNLAFKRSNNKVAVLRFKDSPEERPVKIEFPNICEESSIESAGHLVLDFAVTDDFLFTSSTDSMLRIYSLESQSLVAETCLETLATSLAVFDAKNDDEQLSLHLHYQVGANFTFIALGMINTIAVYKFDMRFFTLSHTVSHLEPRDCIGGT